MKSNEILYYAIKAIAEAFTDEDGNFDYEEKDGIGSTVMLYNHGHSDIFYIIASFCRIIWNEIKK